MSPAHVLINICCHEMHGLTLLWCLCRDVQWQSQDYIGEQALHDTIPIEGIMPHQESPVLSTLQLMPDHPLLEADDDFQSTRMPSVPLPGSYMIITKCKCLHARMKSLTLALVIDLSLCTILTCQHVTLMNLHNHHTMSACLIM